MKVKFGLFLIAIPLILAGLSCSSPSDQAESNQAAQQVESETNQDVLTAKQVDAEQVVAEQKQDVLTGTIPGLQVDNIMTSQLELIEGIEVIVSRVDVPANTTLPKHWHPGEEFIYFMDGSGVIWQKDKADIQIEKGEVFKVPLKQIHTLTTGDSGSTVIVFRVHETGQPVRINVEE